MSISNSGDGELRISGDWITPSVSYVEPKRLFCTLCGRPIARRYWRAAPQGKPLPFCEPAHAELYLTYWLPTHGPATPAKG
jgi:hypothetical protein